MGQKAYKFSETELSWDKIAKITNETYIKCIFAEGKKLRGIKNLK